VCVSGDYPDIQLKWIDFGFWKLCSNRKESKSVVHEMCLRYVLMSIGMQKVYFIKECMLYKNGCQTDLEKKVL
jgi:hypothetical protein